MGFAGHGDLALFHGFKERGLNFGGGAVNFVGEDEVVENGTGLEFELALAFGGVVDLGAGDVAGEKVGSELDSGEARVEEFANFFMARVLASPGRPSTRRFPLARRPMRRRSIMAS